jgi:hypothetical protein
MDEEVEADSRLAAVEGGYRGHDGIRRWWKNMFDGFPDFTIELVEVRDLGDLTLGVLRNRGRGAGSDAWFEETVWQLVEWDEGKIVRWSAHRTEAEALEAVGMRESG